MTSTEFRVRLTNDADFRASVIELLDYPNVPDDLEPLRIWLEYESIDADEDELQAVVARFNDAYKGLYEDEQQFACELLEAIHPFGYSPDDDLLERYFDYDMWTNDLFKSDYYSVRADDGRVYVFSRG